MPKDEWAKARAKDAAKKRRPRSRGIRRYKRAFGGPGAYSNSTVLWFGKYKEKAIRDIPLSYIRWLSVVQSGSQNVAKLAEWLRNSYIPTLLRG